MSLYVPQRHACCRWVDELHQQLADPHSTAAPKGYACHVTSRRLGEKLSVVSDELPSLCTQELSSQPGSTPASVITALVQSIPWESCDAFLAARDFMPPSSTPPPPPPQQHRSNRSSSAPASLSPSPTGAGAAGERCVPVAARHQLLAELRSTPLFQVVSTLMASRLGSSTATGTAGSSATTVNLSHPLGLEQQQQQQQGSSLLAEKATALLLLRPHSTWTPSWGQDQGGAGVEAARGWQALMDTSHLSILEAELSYLREQAEHIEEVLSEGGDMEAQCGSGCVQKLDCAAHGHLGATSHSSSSSGS